jgi:hypothetical protein
MTAHSLHLTTIRFPEISLRTRDAHKLRGYFGTLFQEHSPLLHNHLEDGTSRYAYPLVQYKVLSQVPTLIGMNEGAELLVKLFLRIKEINIEGNVYPILQKNIESRQVSVGVENDLHEYCFSTLWMALNQENYLKYVKAEPGAQIQQLKGILINNILSFYKGIGYRAEERILTSVQVRQRETQFKNNTMLAFEGHFTTNARLPEGIGLGKAVSRGFGTIQVAYLPVL